MFFPGLSFWVLSLPIRVLRAISWSGREEITLALPKFLVYILHAQIYSPKICERR